MSRNLRMSPDYAKEIGQSALIWLAGNEDLLPVFLGSTGAAGVDLRAMADQPSFLASVLDFITMDDRWVVAFCEAEGLAYEVPLAARQSMPGAEAVHWT